MGKRVLILVVVSLAFLACCVPDHWCGAGPLRAGLVFAAAVLVIVAIGDGAEKNHIEQQTGKHRSA